MCIVIGEKGRKGVVEHNDARVDRDDEFTEKIKYGATDVLTKLVDVLNKLARCARYV